MRSSDPARSDWRSPLVVAAIVLALMAGIVAARVVWFDPYWVFRVSPPWLSVTDGSNKLLDRQTRRGKILQALTRPYSIALVGSSTVYHGLDPRDVDLSERGHVYNAGISGLLADELPSIASVVASRREVRRVVLGLDYYMFSRTDRAVRLDPSLRTTLGRTNTLLGSLLGRYAILDSRMSRVEGSDDPGAWTYDGFRITPPLPAALTLENEAIRRRTTVAFVPETLALLEDTLAILSPFQLDVYLAPVSSAQRKVLSDLGHLEDFGRWRAAIAEIAARHRLRFQDLSDLGRDHPFDPAKGSTDAWLDNLHFTPVIGRRVLEAVGLRTRSAGS